VLGILAAIAIPACQDYTHRARVAEGIVAVNPWRSAVAEHYAQSRQLPNAVGDLARDLVPAEPASRYGTPGLGAGGVITLTFSQAAAALAGKTIVFRPQAVVLVSRRRAPTSPRRAGRNPGNATIRRRGRR